MLPPLLAALDFRCNNTAYRPIMHALEMLHRYADVDGKVRFFAQNDRVPLDGVVPKAWHEAVLDERGRVERIPYELCTLIALRDALRRREIYVSGGNRWRNPDDDLPGDFDAAREVHYAALRQPLDPSVYPRRTETADLPGPRRTGSGGADEPATTSAHRSCGAKSTAGCRWWRTGTPATPSSSMARTAT